MATRSVPIPAKSERREIRGGPLSGFWGHRYPVVRCFGLPGGGCVREWHKESDSSGGLVQVECPEALEVEHGFPDDRRAPRRPFEQAVEHQGVHGYAYADRVVESAVAWSK